MSEEQFLPPIVKYSKEHSDFIEQRGSNMDNQWFLLPFVFQKVGDGLYREWLPERLPKDVLKDISILFPNYNFNEAIDKCISVVEMGKGHCEIMNDSKGVSFCSAIISKLQSLKK